MNKETQYNIDSESHEDRAINSKESKSTGGIKCENLSFGYNHNSYIIENFNIEISERSLIGILGPNGAGKSTILRLLSGYLKPLTGSVYVDNQHIASISNKNRAQLIAVVSQNIFSVMPYTVRQIVEMGRVAKVSRLLPLSKIDIDTIDSAMVEMDVIDFAKRQFNSLSGGEQQRVKIAAAIAQEPKILFLDEPTSQLDMGHSINLMRLIENLNKQKKITIAIVSHDIQLMSSFLNRIVMMKDGKIIVDGTPNDIINTKNIQEVYNCNAEIFIDDKKRIHLFPGSL